MLILDASCLYEIVTEGANADVVRSYYRESDDTAAPEIIDAEVLGLIRRDTRSGVLHPSRAEIALAEFNGWPGERFPHRPFNMRVWELRHNVRTWDGYYVALAETLGAPLLTLDRRLASADGPTCEFIVP